MNKLILIYILSYGLVASYEDKAFAEMSVRVGTSTMGTGGANPISIPPVQIFEYEFVYLNQKNKEWSISITPGIFYGQRYFLSKKTYMSLGGGIAIDANGSGFGVYSAIGHKFYCSSICFEIELKQALGLLATHLISPFSLRIGVAW